MSRLQREEKCEVRATEAWIGTALGDGEGRCEQEKADDIKQYAGPENFELARHW